MTLMTVAQGIEAFPRCIWAHNLLVTLARWSYWWAGMSGFSR